VTPTRIRIVPHGGNEAGKAVVPRLPLTEKVHQGGVAERPMM
jgi:hypothetical protein